MGLPSHWANPANLIRPESLLHRDAFVSYPRSQGNHADPRFELAMPADSTVLQRCPPGSPQCRHDQLRANCSADSVAPSLSFTRPDDGYGITNKGLARRPCWILCNLPNGTCLCWLSIRPEDVPGGR